jgi:hypothetical protein
MVKSAIKVLLVVLTAWLVPSMVEASNTTEARRLAATKDCKQSNDFKYTSCGEWGKNYYCCKTRQTCVGPVTPKTGNKLYVCSDNRQLSGQVFIKVVAIPMFFMLMDVFIIAYMVLQLNFCGSPITKLAVAVIAFSWPLYLSSLWAHGCWAAILALLVAQMSKFVRGGQAKLAKFDLSGTELPLWVYRLTWLLQLFHLVSIFGPTEAFHVPLLSYSKVSKYSELIKGDALKDKTCDTYFGNYFKVEKIEKQAKGADPDLEYYGLCSIEFLGFIQALFIFQGMAWMMLLLTSTPTLLSAKSSESKDSEV